MSAFFFFFFWWTKPHILRAFPSFFKDSEDKTGFLSEFMWSRPRVISVTSPRVDARIINLLESSQRHVWAYHRWRMWGISTCQTRRNKVETFLNHKILFSLEIKYVNSVCLILTGQIAEFILNPKNNSSSLTCNIFEIFWAIISFSCLTAYMKVINSFLSWVQFGQIRGCCLQIMLIRVLSCRDVCSVWGWGGNSNRKSPEVRRSMVSQPKEIMQ